MKQAYQWATSRLSGLPDEVLTVVLVVAGVVFIVAAFRGSPVLKAFLAAILVV